MSVLAADGVSFAIPVDTAKQVSSDRVLVDVGGSLGQVIAQLTLQGRVNRPYVGIKMLQLNPYIAGFVMSARNAASISHRTIDEDIATISRC